MKIKMTLLTLFLIAACVPLSAQPDKGTVVVDSLYSTRLENPMGEATTRAVSVYLPPGYKTSGKRYPVIYFLHGFMGDHTLYPQVVEVLDHAIARKKIRPFILVISDQKTSYDGSFYSNSRLFGNWEDFTAFDLVNYMDSNYRTLPDKDSRGITGHSMGGYGALKLAMHHPEIFSSVYALSPGALAIVREYGPNSSTFRELAQIRTAEELKNSYFPKVMVAFGRSWSPNPDNPPFYCDVPFVYEGDSLVTRPEILAKWQENMPVHMIEDNLENLQQLRAIALDWGRNAGERFTQQCDMFSQRLENANIDHSAEEYIGTHVSGIYTKDGRIPNDMLPFFDDHLDFGTD
ncbi:MULTISPECIES: alpha/beta hydrolase [unclassified Robiginitalea]|uniref:alpha/beta hydrolase n=1 Tax=Robiginitalea TaxID=252306 RepID=UPI00234B6FB8|nr:MULTISPECIES: alpha/beta fold hydrolase [unclassified Robiginitalea]MDC6354794.1 alpha/beta fold hydrolase [Robiginitalea sp. PM2]MDC6375060.1 alpha/beta fold hydrolase [Robiginitalea sp. SP8]